MSEKLGIPRNCPLEYETAGLHHKFAKPWEETIGV